MTFVTKDSGERDEFDTGYRRDSQAGKPRYDLISQIGLLRLAQLYQRGAEKYGDDNWQKGSPFRRTFAAMFRHMLQWAAGDRSEDHLAAVAWNAFTLMDYEYRIIAGDLPANLNDMNIELVPGQRDNDGPMTVDEIIKIVDEKLSTAHEIQNRNE